MNEMPIVVEKFLRNNKVFLDSLCELDEETLDHSIRVFKLSKLLGEAAKLSKEDIDNLALGSIFHDIGKRFVPQKTLNKPGKLSDEEFEMIKVHSKLGYEFMKVNGNLPDAALEIVLDHHEKLDGSGYPAKKSGSEIGTLARIVAICDIYDALTSPRVYRKKLSVKDAKEIIVSSACDKLDDKLVGIFLTMVLPKLNKEKTTSALLNNVDVV